MVDELGLLLGHAELFDEIAAGALGAGNHQLGRGELGLQHRPVAEDVPGVDAYGERLPREPGRHPGDRGGRRGEFGVYQVDPVPPDERGQPEGLSTC